MDFLKKLFGLTEDKRAETANEADIVDLYRKRFRNSLVGKWVTAEGIFPMQGDVFEFFESGKGYWLSLGASYEWKTNFDWRQKKAFTVEIRIEEEEDHWIEIEYDFKLIENDVAKQVILHGRNSDTFYLAITRVGYGGQINPIL